MFITPKLNKIITGATLEDVVNSERQKEKLFSHLSQVFQKDTKVTEYQKTNLFWNISERSPLTFVGVEQMPSNNCIYLYFSTHLPSGGFKYLNQPAKIALLDNGLYICYLNDKNKITQQTLYLPKDYLN